MSQGEQTDSAGHIKAEEEEEDENTSESQLATFEAAIAQLQIIMENPSISSQMNLNQNQEQFQLLLEKYDKIEQLVFVEQEQIEQLINKHLQLQQDVHNECAYYQTILAQGKRDILRLILINKQSLNYQNAGQKTLQMKQQEAEKLVYQIAKLQKDISAIKVIIQDKQAEENKLDAMNSECQNTIDEFRRDQNDQKEGLEQLKDKLAIREREAKAVKREQMDMQRKLDQLRRNAIEVKQKIGQFQSSQEVAISELKKEKRTLVANEKRYEEISKGLESLEQEGEKSNTHLDEIRQVNANMKNKVQLFENSLIVFQSEGPESDELKTLENLLQQYNQLLTDKQTIIATKNSEKALLQEHLSQLSLFAEQFLQKQNNSAPPQEEVQPPQTSNQFGMECIQSQYEQEQDSQFSTKIQSKQSVCSPANNHFIQEQKHFPTSSSVEETSQQAVHEVDDLQVHRYNQHIGLASPSESDTLNVEKYAAHEQLLHSGGSSENVELECLEESGAIQREERVLEKENMDSDQQKIASELKEGGISLDGVKLREFLKEYDEKEAKQPRKSGEKAYSYSQESSSQLSLSDQHRIMSKMVIPQIAYQQLFNQIKQNLVNSDSNSIPEDTL